MITIDVRIICHITARPVICALINVLKSYYKITTSYTKSSSRNDIVLDLLSLMLALGAGVGWIIDAESRL